MLHTNQVAFMTNTKCITLFAVNVRSHQINYFHTLEPRVNLCFNRQLNHDN